LCRYLKYSRNCKRNFLNFSNQYLHKTPIIREVKELRTLDYDAIVVGSDQVWNCSQHASQVYFLDWVRKGCKRISYAACCGRNVIKDGCREKLCSELNKFDKLSVRSAETFKFIYQLIGKKPYVVCDPTMLYPFDEFKSYIEGNYLIVYVLGKDIVGGNAYVIKKIKEKYPNIKVYAIQIGDRCTSYCEWADKELFNISPIEWIRLIYNSSFVFTDSFHGSVFAMKFGKPLVAYYNSPVTGQRFKDLEQTFYMKNVITDANQIDAILSSNSEHDYMYKDIIESHIQESLDFIKSI
jgi:hypothetical protein